MLSISDRRNIRGLQALRALHHIKRDSLSFSKRTEPLHLDLTEMHEEIFPFGLLNESIALFGTKPLHSPLSQPCNLHLFRSDTEPVPTPL